MEAREADVWAWALALAVWTWALPAAPTAEAAPAAPGERLDRYGVPLPAGAVARLGRMRLCSPYGVRAAAFSADGKRLTCFHGWGRATVWDSAGRRRLHRIFAGDDSTNPFAVSADGSTAVWAGGDAFVRIWSLARGKMLAKHKLRHGAASVALSRDGTLLLTSDGTKGLRLWNVGTFRVRREFLCSWDKRALHLAMSDDGKFFAAAGPGRRIGVWRLRAGKMLHEFAGFRSEAVRLAFRPDGHALAAGLQDGTVHLLDPAEGTRGDVLGTSRVAESHTSPPRVRVRFHYPQEVASLAWSRDGRRLAVAYRGSGEAEVRVWDVGEKQVLLRLPAGRTVAFAPNGRVLATGTSEMLRFWLARDGTELEAGDGHTADVSAVAVSPGGKLLATASADCTIRLWRLPDGKALGVVGRHAKKVWSLTFCSGGEVLASSGKDRRLRFWHVRDRKQLREVPLGRHWRYWRHLAASPDGKAVAAFCSDATVCFYDPLTGRETLRLTDVGAEGGRLAFSADGKLLAIAHPKGLSIRDAASGKVLRQFASAEHRIFPGAFSADLRLAMVAKSGQPLLLELARGKALRALSTHETYITAGAFSPDGRVLAAASYDGEVRLYRTEDGRRLASLTGHLAAVNAVAWVADGTMLATASSDASVLLWDVRRHAAAPKAPNSSGPRQPRSPAGH